MPVATTAGLAFLRAPARSSSASSRRRQALVVYLRDHLGGADMAIRVVHRLGSAHRGTVAGVAAGGAPGDLSLFRTLEALAIGVQGKRCLWRALQRLRTVPSTVEGMTLLVDADPRDFAEDPDAPVL